MKTGIQLAAITAGNLLMWFLFQGYILFDRGASYEADAFFASITLPQLVMLIANSSLMHVLVPFFANEDDLTIRRNVYALLWVMLLVFFPVIALLYLSAPYWVPWFVIGFPDAAKALTVTLARIQVLGMAFTACTAVLISACHGKRQFGRAEFAPFLATLLAFAALLVVYPRYGVAGAAWLMAARPLVGMAFLLPNFGRPVAPDRIGLGIVWQRVKPLLLSSAYYKSDQLLDRFLSSMGRSGDLSMFYFAYQVHSAAHVILGKALCATVVPDLARYAKARNWDRFASLYRRRLVLVTVVAACCCASLLILRVPLLRFVSGFAGDTADLLDRSYWLLVLLSGTLIGGLAGLVLAESFFAMGNTRTPAVVLTLSFTVGIAMKSVGFLHAGINGLALGTSAFCCVSPLILLLLLERDLNKLCRKRSGPEHRKAFYSRSVKGLSRPGAVHPVQPVRCDTTASLQTRRNKQ